MKRIWLIAIGCLLLASAGLFAQKNDTLNVQQLFNGVTLADSAAIAWNADSSYFVLTTPVSDSVFTSAQISHTTGGLLESGGGDICFYIRMWKRSAASINTTVRLGVYRGPEYGYDWYSMNNFTSAGRAKFCIQDQSWSSELFEHLVLEIRENGAVAQSNNYAIRLVKFNWKS